MLNYNSYLTNGGVLFVLVIVLGLFLFSCGDPTQKYLDQLSNEDSKVRISAVSKLGELKDERAIEPLFNALTDSSREVRKEALNALVKFGPAVIPYLKEPLDFNDARVYLAAVDILCQINDPKAIDLLLYSSQSITLKGKHQKILFALKSFGAPTADRLHQLINDESVERSEKDEYVRMLGEMKDERYFDFFYELAMDRSSSSFYYARESFGMYGEKAAIKLSELAIDTYLKFPIPQRVRAIENLRFVDHPLARETLKNMSNSPNRDISNAAKRSLREWRK